MHADDSGFRITEDASDYWVRSETGEAVRIPIDIGHHSEMISDTIPI